MGIKPAEFGQFSHIIEVPQHWGDYMIFPQTTIGAGAFAQPEKNILELGVLESKTVADLGAGSGAYSIAAGRRVGNSGKVYAIDVQKELLGRINDLARNSGLSNVYVLWGLIDKLGGTTLRDGECHAAIMSNVFFQVEAKDLCAKEVARILRVGGDLLFIEWSDSFGHLGPHPDKIVKPEQAERFFAMAGMRVKKQFNAGPHHYGMVFTKV